MSWKICGRNLKALSHGTLSYTILTFFLWSTAGGSVMKIFLLGIKTVIISTLDSS